MIVTEYLDAIKERLTTAPVVADFSIVRERVTLVDGHLRARLAISDGSMLEFSEYVQRSPDGQIDVVTYSYHWADADGNLIRRWDNTPHFPRFARFPTSHPQWPRRFGRPWETGQHIPYPRRNHPASLID